MRGVFLIIAVSTLLLVIPNVGILEGLLGPPPLPRGRMVSIEATHGTVKLHVETSGGGGPAIVLIHGFSGSTYSWHRVAPKLAKTNKVIAIDLLGFGQSEKPEGASYTLNEQAGLVAAVIAKLNLTDATLVGSSLGGNVALRVALLVPLRVARIVLIGTPPAPQALEAVQFSGAAFWAVNLLVQYVPPELMIAYASRRLYPMSAWPELAQIRIHGRALRQPGGSAAFLATLRGLIDDLHEPVVPPNVPVLLVWCDDDTFVTLQQRRAHQRILKAVRQNTLKECAHAPHYLKPGKLAHAIALFHVEQR